MSDLKAHKRYAQANEYGAVERYGKSLRHRYLSAKRNLKKADVTEEFSKMRHSDFKPHERGHMQAQDERIRFENRLSKLAEKSRTKREAKAIAHRMMRGGFADQSARLKVLAKELAQEESQARQEAAEPRKQLWVRSYKYRDSMLDPSLLEKPKGSIYDSELSKYQRFRHNRLKQEFEENLNAQPPPLVAVEVFVGAQEGADPEEVYAAPTFLDYKRADNRNFQEEYMARKPAWDEAVQLPYRPTATLGSILKTKK